MTLHNITEFYTKQFNVCPNITSKYQTTTTFKISIKKIIQIKIVGMSKIF
jgi:hypothetical protein